MQEQVSSSWQVNDNFATKVRSLSRNYETILPILILNIYVTVLTVQHLLTDIRTIVVNIEQSAHVLSKIVAYFYFPLYDSC